LSATVGAKDVSSNRFPLTLLPGRFAVCRLEPSAAVPPWADGVPLASVTRTAEELSVVCAEEAVPAGVKAETGWKALRLEGPVPFSTVGVISGLTAPLAAQGIPVFVLSTFDTDYLLLKESVLGRAQKALAKAGYPVR
jgi:hypothetical protein